MVSLTLILYFGDGVARADVNRANAAQTKLHFMKGSGVVKSSGSTFPALGKHCTGAWNI